MISCRLILIAAFVGSGLNAQEMHDHPVPEKLGQVSFPISCAPQSQAAFNRGIALLHSFAYSAATDTFRKVEAADPNCAIAHWGIAMSCFHQLWGPEVVPSCIPLANEEIETAKKIGSGSARELAYIDAFSFILKDANTTPFSERNQRYEQAMSTVARDNKDDVEAQVFYALSLLSNAAPTDKSHQRQKKALAILEPLDKKYPNHPGITHYIIHACDSTELAANGLPAAKKYAEVAPSVPHALHMPSHIFTRLGLWEDSISSNLAASKAALAQGDKGEELHAMDYLVYADLQLGRYEDARRVLDHLENMKLSSAGDFKVGYAATAMPVRYAVERARWDEAANLKPIPGSSPQVASIAVWARSLGRTRNNQPADITLDIAELQKYQDQLHQSANEYWAAQVRILREEAIAWSLAANSKSVEAVATMRRAADEEDSLEKLPVTPGPIVPAREQLGELLLMQNHLPEAAIEFRASLRNSPGRRGAIRGLSQSNQAASR